jgi:hypothetical protein
MFKSRNIFYLISKESHYFSGGSVNNVYETITGISIDDITQEEIEQKLISVNVWE